MEEQPDVPINPNTADLDSLRRIPGVGPALAQRILEGRPYVSIDDLRRVPGLGPVVLARMTPHLSFAGEGAGEEEAGGLSPIGLPESGVRIDSNPVVQPASPGGKEEAGVAPTEEGTKPPSPPAKVESAAPGPAEGPVIRETKPPALHYSRSETLTLVVGSAVASALVSILVTLLVLAGINGTLDVSRHRTVRTMQADLAAMKEGLTDLTNEMASAEARLDALEGLTGRMTAIETRVGEQNEALAGALEEIDAMRSTVDTVTQQMEGLAARVDRFSRFLDGLGRVLSDLATPPAGEDQPPATPVP